MDPATLSALFLIFIATEKVVGYAGGKIADSFSKPIWEALEEKAKALAGTDETSKRWRDFEKSFAEAKNKFLKDAKDPETAKILLEVLETLGDYTKENNEWLISLSDEMERLSLVGETPDVDALVKLCLVALEKKGAKLPKRADLADAARDFLILQRNCMFAKPAYRQLLKDQALWDKLQQRYDTRERYIDQVIKHYQDLDFVGIPELKDRQALCIEDVFISLQSQEETLSEPHEIMRRAREMVIDGALNEADIRDSLERDEWPRVTRRLSINQALAENLKMIILGDPGSGKTTLLKYITLAFAENHPQRLGLKEKRLPIFIRMYDYVARRSECVGNGFSFVDYLDKFACDHLQLNLAPTFFAEALERGDCCVCLDGLDELGAAGLRREVTANVAALVNRYSRNRFIVTSRIVGYEEAPLDRREFAHQTIQPLSDDDIKLFVEKWYKAREKDPVVRKERTEHLTKTIMEQERIKSLAANPLMLTIIALVHRIEAELPHERVKLYDKCVTTLVETWDKVRGMKYSLRRRLLEKLAYWMHTQPGERGRMREVREGNLELQLRYFLETDPKLQLDEDQIQHEVEEFLNLAKTRSGLLVERGVGLYTFSHLTFQEFLAACDIEHRLVQSVDAIWAEIQPKLHDAHWREVILLLLGALNRYDFHNSDLVRRIYEGTDPFEPMFHRHLFLAARALADHVVVDATLHNGIIDDLLALAASQEYVRWDVFEILGRLQGDTRAAVGLLALARDEKVDNYVHIAAAQAFGKLGSVNEALLNDLLALARDEKADAMVRYTAAGALGQLRRADEAAELLLTLARDEKVDAMVHIAAMQDLGQLGRADEAAGLLLALACDGKVNKIARYAATQALGKLGRADEAVLNGLLALVQDEKVIAELRSAAAQALGHLGRVDEAAVLLLALARDEKVNAELRSAAAQALGQLGRADEAAGLLLVLARNGKMNEVSRYNAAQALGQLERADEAVLNGLLALVYDKKVDARVCSAAARALGQLGRVDEAVLNSLLALARDEKVEAGVRSAVAGALGQLGRVDEAAGLLLALTRDEKVDAGVRSATAQALGQLGRVDEAAGLLLAQARDEKVEAGVRRASAKALVQLGRTDEAAGLLLALAGDEKVDNWVRSAAAEALGQLGRAEEAVLSGLLTLARDGKVHEWVRSAAYRSLKALLAGESAA